MARDTTRPEEIAPQILQSKQTCSSVLCVWRQQNMSCNTATVMLHNPIKPQFTTRFFFYGEKPSVKSTLQCLLITLVLITLQYCSSLRRRWISFFFSFFSKFLLIRYLPAIEMIYNTHFSFAWSCFTAVELQFGFVQLNLDESLTNIGAAEHNRWLASDWITRSVFLLRAL